MARPYDWFIVVQSARSSSYTRRDINPPSNLPPQIPWSSLAFACVSQAGQPVTSALLHRACWETAFAVAVPLPLTGPPADAGASVLSVGASGVSAAGGNVLASADLWLALLALLPHSLILRRRCLRSLSRLLKQGYRRACERLEALIPVPPQPWHLHRASTCYNVHSATTAVMHSGASCSKVPSGEYSGVGRAAAAAAELTTPSRNWNSVSAASKSA